MKLVKLKLSDIVPYENNPRKNDEAVNAVAESIRQCSYITPIIVDEEHVILAGHTRYKALVSLGIDEVQCLVCEGLSEEDKKKYRYLDNKTGEKATWDLLKLEKELEGLDLEGIAQEKRVPINQMNLLGWMGFRSEFLKVANLKLHNKPVSYYERKC